MHFKLAHNNAPLILPSIVQLPTDMEGVKAALVYNLACMVMALVSIALIVMFLRMNDKKKSSRGVPMSGKRHNNRLTAQQMTKNTPGNGPLVGLAMSSSNNKRWSTATYNTITKMWSYGPPLDKGNQSGSDTSLSDSESTDSDSVKSASSSL